METLVCKNCGKESNTKFCPNCGQQIIKRSRSADDIQKMIELVKKVTEIDRKRGTGPADLIMVIMTTTALMWAQGGEMTPVDALLAGEKENERAESLKELAKLI